MPPDTGDESDRSITRAELLERVRVVKSGVAERAATAGRTLANRLASTSVGSRVRSQLTDWPEALDARVDVTGERPSASDSMPEGGDLVCYVHGFLGEGRVDSIPASGAHQAAALDAALADAFAGRPAAPPSVAAVMWDSSTVWWRATRRAKPAGRTFADWLAANADRYDSVTILGHSLGGRVTLFALDALDGTTVDSVGLFGAAVDPDAVCTQFRRAIESRVSGPVYSYHSANDYAICYFYRVLVRGSALGCRGSDCGAGSVASDRLPENYADVDVSESVRDHRDYYRPSDETFESGSCVETVVRRQLAARE